MSLLDICLTCNILFSFTLKLSLSIISLLFIPLLINISLILFCCSCCTVVSYHIVLHSFLSFLNLVDFWYLFSFSQYCQPLTPLFFLLFLQFFPWFLSFLPSVLLAFVYLNKYRVCRLMIIGTLWLYSLLFVHIYFCCNFIIYYYWSIYSFRWIYFMFFCRDIVSLMIVLYWSSTTCQFLIILRICFFYISTVGTPSFVTTSWCLCLIFLFCSTEATASFCFFFIFFSHTFFTFSIFIFLFS